MRVLECFMVVFLSTVVFFGCKQGTSGQGADSGQSQNQKPQSSQAPGQNPSQGQGQPGQGQTGNRKPSVITVQAMIAHIETLKADRLTSGVVVAVTQSQVAAQGSGNVLRIVRQAGNWVNKDDIVVQLDDAQLKLSLANAQAVLDNAKINLAVGQDNTNQANPKLDLQVQSAQSALDAAQKTYDAQKELFDLGGTSASQVDSSLSQLKLAQANLAAAKTALDQNRNSETQSIAQLKLSVDQAANQLAQAQLNVRNAAIRAPFAGQVAAVAVSPGMFVGSNTAAFTLVSPDKQVSFSVSPAEAPALAANSSINFTYNGKPFPVRLNVMPSAPVNGVVPMTGLLAGGTNLPYGAIGTISYSVSLATGAVIPISAIESLENRIFVNSIVDGKTVVRFITILAETGDKAAVAGIEGGTMVVVNSPPGMIEHASVQTIMLDQLGSPANQPGSNPGGKNWQVQSVKPGATPWPGQKRQKPTDGSAMNSTQDSKVNANQPKDTAQ